MQDERQVTSRVGSPQVLISALHYEWETPEEAFDRCLNEFGLGGIEFSIHEGGSRPHLSPSEYDRIAELAEAWPLLLSGHVWGDLAQLGAGQAVGQLEEWLAVARHLRFRYLIVHGGTHHDREAGVQLMGEVLGEVAGRYAAAGVTLCIENHYAWEYQDCHELFGSAAELVELFGHVSDPAVGFCLDYGHSHMTGNTQELLDEVGHRLVYTHLADNLGEHDDHLAFGEGTVPWLQVLSATRDTGFRGPFTVEFPVRGGNLEPLRDCLDLIAASYAH
jgi:sugar phosphate isomerase/epimerase